VEYGTVKWYDEQRGTGSIVRDEGGRELTVAHSSIACDGFKVLFEGQRVEFEIAGTATGPAAVNVKPCCD
jgi:CspA family cold shock protein